MSTSLQTTPLDAWHRAAGAKMVPFAGFEMPIHYGSIVAEHNTCRGSGVLFDVSHMGRLRLDGDGAADLLDWLLTRRVTDLSVGQTRYSLICREDGGVLDDVLVSNLETPSGQQYFLLVVNASNRQKIWEWILPHLDRFPGVRLTDRTELTAMIAVQGPKVMAACGRFFKFDPNRLKYYRSVITEHLGKPTIISRTGYTGEDGFELIVRAEEAVRVWENMLLAGRDAGFTAAGLGARDTLRTEAGMPLYGHELSETITPVQAGLTFACNLASRDFVGRDTIEQLMTTGANQTRVGLLPDTKRVVRDGSAIFSAAQQPSDHQPSDQLPIGQVTSGCPSPTLGYPIAMGYVNSSHSKAERVLVDLRGEMVPARIVPLPFYRRPS